MQKTIILILLLIFLVGCSAKSSNFDKFDSYCSSYCVSVGMVEADGTKEEQHTFNCVCEKIFLKSEWIKANVGGR